MGGARATGLLRLYAPIASPEAAADYWAKNFGVTGRVLRRQ
jgi:hypothetical protein